MAMQDKQSRIDARWLALQPGWGRDHSSELRLLYRVLQDDEEIEALVPALEALVTCSGKEQAGWTGCGRTRV